MSLQTSLSPVSPVEAPLDAVDVLERAILAHAQCFKTASGFKLRYVDIRRARRCSERAVRRETRCEGDVYVYLRLVEPNETICLGGQWHTY
jgi:hypothetical protein